MSSKQIKSYAEGLVKNLSLADWINYDAVDFLKSEKGQKLLRLANSFAAKYDTKYYPLRYKYRKKDDNLKIRIFFSGLPDSEFISYGKHAMEDAYGPSGLYMFGHKQLPLALKFALLLDPKIPVLVYGFSWGSTAARDFADAYKGNITGLHFMDPMRKKPSAKLLLLVAKKISDMTYTAAFTRPHSPLSAAIHNALRFKPSEQFKIYPKVKDHLSLAQWLRQLKLKLLLNKAASIKIRNNMLSKFNKIARLLKIQSIYDGMSEKKIERLINKKIKKVPDKYPYLSLLDRLRVAYMLRCLKKARSKDNLNALFGSLNAVASKDPRWNQRGPSDFFFESLKSRLNSLDPSIYKKVIKEPI